MPESSSPLSGALRIVEPHPFLLDLDMTQKYIDADKLITEIERRKGYISVTHFAEELLSFIDSLQQEQSCNTCTNDKGCVTCKDGELWEGKEQHSEDLEKEIERFLGSEESTSYTNAGGYTVAFKDTIKIARHFYELGKGGK